MIRLFWINLNDLSKVMLICNILNSISICYLPWIQIWWKSGSVFLPFIDVLQSFFVSLLFFFWNRELCYVLYCLFNFSCIIWSNWVRIRFIRRLFNRLIKEVTFSVIQDLKLLLYRFSRVLLNSRILTRFQFCIWNILSNLFLSPINLGHCFLLITLSKRLSMTIWSWRSRRKCFPKLSILLIRHVSNLRIGRLFNKLSLMKIVLLLWLHTKHNWIKISRIVWLDWLSNLYVWDPVHVILKFTSRTHK